MPIITNWAFFWNSIFRAKNTRIEIFLENFLPHCVNGYKLKCRSLFLLLYCVAVYLASSFTKSFHQCYTFAYACATMIKNKFAVWLKEANEWEQEKKNANKNDSTMMYGNLWFSIFPSSFDTLDSSSPSQPNNARMIRTNTKPIASIHKSFVLILPYCVAVFRINTTFPFMNGVCLLLIFVASLPENIRHAYRLLGCWMRVALWRVSETGKSVYKTHSHTHDTISTIFVGNVCTRQ